MDGDGDGNEAVRERESAQHRFDANNDPEPGGADGKLDVEPGPGGYEGRDPKKEMPRVPSVPETQHDPRPHDAAPDSDKP